MFSRKAQELNYVIQDEIPSHSVVFSTSLKPNLVPLKVIRRAGQPRQDPVGTEGKTLEQPIQELLPRPSLHQKKLKTPRAINLISSPSPD